MIISSDYLNLGNGSFQTFPMVGVNYLQHNFLILQLTKSPIRNSYIQW